MNIWLRLQQTLYTKCISESVFGLLCLLFLFLAVEFLLCRDPCLMLILLFPGKLLSSGQSRTQSVKIPPPSLTSVALGSPTARRLADCCRSSASVVLLTLQ